MSDEYHLQFDRVGNEHWPPGNVTVYNISNEQIVTRTIFSEIVKPERGPAYYTGPVIARHPWCGYLGMFKTLAEAVAAIEKDQASKAAKKKHL